MLGLVVIPFLAVWAKDDLTLAVHEDRGQIEIRFKEKPLLVYAFATNQFKPYVRELYSLNGENVLRDAPADHLHHHGLMYAIRVNGTNFWEERDSPGIERPVKLLAHSTGKSTAGLPQAKFTQWIHWLSPTDRSAANSKAVALLLEERTLTLKVNEKSGEVALQWDAVFEVGPGRVTLHGTDYNGLGLRLPQSFDHVAVFQNSEKSPYAGANTRNNIVARWTSVTGNSAKGEITVALFASPINPGVNTSFFTLLEPFAYLAATQALDKQTFEYAPGDRFRLRYLLTIYDKPKSADFVQRRYDDWSKNGN